MRHPGVVVGLTLDVYRCSLARATGPFSNQVRLIRISQISRVTKIKKAAGVAKYGWLHVTRAMPAAG